MFSIAINHNANYTAISNTEESFRVDRGRELETFFFDTPLVSPSSLAFFVSGFLKVERETNNGYKHFVSVRATEMNYTQKLLEKTDKTLDAVESFMNAKLPKGVLHSVVLPNFDFDVAAFYSFNYYRFV